MHLCDTAAEVQFIYRDKTKCADASRVWLATIWENLNVKPRDRVLGRDYCVRHGGEGCLEISVDCVKKDLIAPAGEVGVVDHESPTARVVEMENILQAAKVVYVSQAGQVAVDIAFGFSGAVQCGKFVNFDPDPPVRPDHCIITVHVPRMPADFTKAQNVWVELWRNHIELVLAKCTPLGRK